MMGEMTFADVFAVIMAIAFVVAIFGGRLATRPEPWEKELTRRLVRREGGNDG
jgi:hypothetical protein